jgi:hypothetical protein
VFLPFAAALISPVTMSREIENLQMAFPIFFTGIAEDKSLDKQFSALTGYMSQ